MAGPLPTADLRLRGRPGNRRNAVALAMYVQLHRNPVLAVGAMALILLTWAGCGVASPQQYETTASNDTEKLSVTRPALSDSARAGEDLFDANCSLCHGVNAAGTHQGPPLIHKVYTPGHHSDFSIRNAVRRGVRQHHWQLRRYASRHHGISWMTCRRSPVTFGRCSAPTASLRVTLLALRADPSSPRLGCTASCSENYPRDTVFLA